MTSSQQSGPALGIVLVGAASLDAERREMLAGQMFGKALPYSELRDVSVHAFGASAVLRLDPDLGIASAFSPSPNGRAELDEEEVMLIRPAGGRMTVSFCSQPVQIGPREAVLLSGGGQVQLSLDRVERLDLIRTRTSRLGGPPMDEPEPLHRISRDHPGLQMLGVYAAGLLRGLMPVRSPDIRDLVEEHLLGLLGNIVRRRNDSTGEASRRADDRLQAIKAEIEISVGRHDLTAAIVARSQRVSARHVQQLFKAEGSTFSDYLLGRRLELARQILVSADGTRPISEIAFAVGFGDISYFNRTFKRRYGETPRQSRTWSQRDHARQEA